MQGSSNKEMKVEDEGGWRRLDYNKQTDNNTGLYR